jgi:hypothetical protein
MKQRFLRAARRYGHFTIRGILYAQRLVARDELAVALIRLKRDARKAARAAMDYLESGGRVEERLTLEKREQILGLIRAQVECEVRELKQWQKARNRLGGNGAVGPATGRPSFCAPSPVATEPLPTPATHPSASTEQFSPPNVRSISSRKRLRSATAGLDLVLCAVGPAPSPAVPFPQRFGLCPPQEGYSLTLLIAGLFSFRKLNERV